MPLTQLDTNAALVLIDLQKGIIGLPLTHSAQKVVARASQLAHAFRQRGLPVVLVNVAGRPASRIDATMPSFNLPPDWTELVPELNQQPTDYHVTKHSFGAFIGTDLDAYLRERNVTQIVLAGIATSIGVESTARSAYDLGYHVVFVTDAMADLKADTHRNSIENIFPRLGESDTTENVLSFLHA